MFSTVTDWFFLQSSSLKTPLQKAKIVADQKNQGESYTGILLDVSEKYTLTMIGINIKSTLFPKRLV